MALTAERNGAILRPHCQVTDLIINSKGILEGDLADLPEQPDELTYIFSLRQEARF